ncbi:MAG: hypothetical protein DMF88_17245 [Acidobacteria bacterium]|nr:MAG: hypothetical protein DMF88_17245 [Acidobacteriota bacterium]
MEVAFPAEPRDVVETDRLDDERVAVPVREAHAVVRRELIVVLVALAAVERKNAELVLDAVEQPDLLILLDDPAGYVRARDTDRLIAAVGGIDIRLAVIEAADLLPVLRLVDRLVPLRAALHRRLVRLEAARAPQATLPERARERRAPVAREIGMAVRITRGLAVRLQLPHDAVLRRDALAARRVGAVHGAQRQVGRTLCARR